uniref:Uncharacterized protein MANES_02G078600 n=1 Tax=Rhizophora mucronata TaxID=61149 RepID=A0A2P2M6K3_RHIMU
MGYIFFDQYVMIRKHNFVCIFLEMRHTVSFPTIED